MYHKLEEHKKKINKNFIFMIYFNRDIFRSVITKSFKQSDGLF